MHLQLREFLQEDVSHVPVVAIDRAPLLQRARSMPSCCLSCSSSQRLTPRGNPVNSVESVRNEVVVVVATGIKTYAYGQTNNCMVFGLCTQSTCTRIATSI